ncbi:MAG: hypothetical protein KIT84_20790 [Labilithrix sp.]|nr:hypothetical protein [Labilithrix sp.]MCW5813479.1 hypothetical protein [Labilithrix sp.]
MAARLEDLPTAPAGELRLEVEVGACFSGAARTIVVRWSNEEASISAGGHELPRSSAEARAIVARVVEAALRPEVPNGSRSTTNHQARLTWTVGQTSGTKSLWTNEMRSDQVAKLVASAPELAAKAPPDAYSAAIALFELAGALLAEHARRAVPRD